MDDGSPPEWCTEDYMRAAYQTGVVLPSAPPAPADTDTALVIAEAPADTDTGLVPVIEPKAGDKYRNRDRAKDIYGKKFRAELKATALELMRLKPKLYKDYYSNQ